MKSNKQPKGVRNIKTALTGDKRGSEQRVVHMRRLVNLETQRNRLSIELQNCLQKQHHLKEQIEEIIFEVEQIHKELSKDVVVSDEKRLISTKLRTKEVKEAEGSNKKKFVIEY